MKTILLILLFTGITYSQLVPEWSAAHQFAPNSVYEHKTYTIDPSGNIYTAMSYDSGNGWRQNVIVNKYDPTGGFVWSRVNNFPPPDSTTNTFGIFHYNTFIYVLVGTRSFSGGYSKIIILKYDPNGILQNSYINVFSGGNIKMNSSAIDGNGNFYMTGTGIYYDNINVWDSLFTIKINSTGQQQWRKNLRGSWIYYNSGSKVITDASGNAYITGTLGNNVTYQDVLLLKYSPDGNILINQTINNRSLDDELSNEIILDSDQNIYIGGTAGSSADSVPTESFVIKFNSSGTFQWKRAQSQITGNGGESVNKILIDNQNNLYCYAYHVNSTYIFKLNSSGQQQWLNTYTTTPAVNNININNNNLYTIGDIQGFNRRDLSIQKLSSVNGSLQYAYTFSHQGTGSSRGYNIDISNDSKIFIEGLYNNNILFAKFTGSLANSSFVSRSGLNKPINDNQFTYDTIIFNLPANSFVKDVFLTIDTILHPSIVDLEISLIHGNTEDTLVYRRGGPFADYINTNLGDTSNLNICGSAYPYTGYYKPCKPFSQFRTLPANDPWILKIRDRQAPNTGTLKAWKMNLIYEYPIGITQISSEVPKEYSLIQNYPNPFNPVTRIRFSVPEYSFVKIIVYDITGRVIKNLVEQNLSAGMFETEFDGSSLASGIYFYRIEAGNFIQTKKMVLVK